MKNLSTGSKIIYYRLIALWAVAEGLLGGIIHSIQLPVSGLVVGGFAIICISLIAYFYPVKGAVLRATVLVCIFKMLLSPHSSIMAYIAVFFQGILGEFIVNTRNKSSIRIYIFVIASLLESALQRILVMTLIYGKKIWTALDAFISGLTHSDTITHYSYFIAGGYTLLHIVAGIFISMFILRIRKQLAESSIPANPELLMISDEVVEKKKKPIQWFYYSIYVILLLLFFQAKMYPENSWFPSGAIVELLIRSALILLSWNLILSPVLRKLLHRWLIKKKEKNETEIHAILELLPSTQLIIKHSWKNAGSKNGLSRINLFLKEVFIQSFAHARS